MTYNVFGGTLNPAQSNPIHAAVSPHVPTVWSGSFFVILLILLQQTVRE